MMKQDDYMPMAYEEHIKNRVQRSWGNSIYISYPKRSVILMDIIKEYNNAEWRKITESSSHYYSARVTPTVKNARKLCEAFRDGAEAGCTQCKSIYRNIKSNSKAYIFEIQYKDRKVKFDDLVSKIC